MRKVFLSTLFVFASALLFSQPASSVIKADIMKEMGPNCTTVELKGAGTTAKEYVDGAWSVFYRVPVHATLKTEMNGVTRLMKGSAWYAVNGNSYNFKKYNPGTAEYVGFPAPDVAEIKAFIMSLPDYGLGGTANRITEVNEMDIRNTPAQWHTLLSVSVPADVTYTYKKNNTQLEKVKEPFMLRLYRTDANAKWNRASFMTPDQSGDDRRKVVLGTETISEYKMNQIKTILEKNMMVQNQNHMNSLPEVSIPVINNTTELANWLNSVFMEQNPEKAEKILLQLLYKSHYNSAGSLNPEAQQMMLTLKSAVKNDFSSYKDQYCTRVNIKEQTASSVEWWNKDKSKSCRCATTNENGRWFITELRVGVWDFHFSKYAEKTAAAKCF